MARWGLIKQTGDNSDKAMKGADWDSVSKGSSAPTRGAEARDDLEVLLLAWLSEEDARRAELRFNDYFRAAFPQLCRYIRSLRADGAHAQDVAQQALVKLFTHLGKTRKTADQQVSSALSELHPLNFGPLHMRRVHAWQRHVGAFRDAAIGFRITPSSCPADRWKELRAEINGRVEPLIQQGTSFLDEARVRVASALDSLTANQSAGAHASVTAGSAGVAAEVRLFVRQFLGYAEGRQDEVVEAALACAGAVGFVTRVNQICNSLPALSIPSNGLLYTIARRQFIDSVRGRRERQADCSADLADDGRSVLEELDLDSDRAEVRQPEVPSELTYPSDPENCDSELERRYVAFVEFLRAPLTRAEGALESAICLGRATPERTRAESLKGKYARLIAVLAALREEPQPTEDEIARRLGLTRNQVKYAIEKIREEFRQFFSDLAPEAGGRRKGVSRE